jgi:DNA sulfur modification protein DndB
VNPTKPYLTEFLRFRRSEDEINKIKEFILAYWNCMVENINVIQEFLSTEEKPADKFRNSETGGSLLFRPVGILPFVSTTLDIVQRTQHGLAKILLKFNQVNLVLNRSPWAQVLWNVHSNTMIMGSSALVKLLLLYLYDEQLLSKNELVKLKVGYAAKINYNSEEDPALNNVLQIIKM